MARQIAVDLMFNANTSQARAQIEQLASTLQQIKNTQVTIDQGSISNAVQSANQLQQALSKAFNTKTNTLDFSSLTQSLKLMGTDLATVGLNLSSIGPKGQQAFSQLAIAISSATMPAKRLNSTLMSFGDTLLRTVKWQVASTMIHGFIRTVKDAVNYLTDLDTSLNKIQLITQKSNAEMESFAVTAGKMADRLSSTAKEISDASLIFFQQGLDTGEVVKRAETTVKLAKVTGQSLQDVSSQLTAIWNNFRHGSESVERYADVITALGAATASSSAEIAEGLQKFAAVADTVDLSYEKATAALATVVAQTRQSADIVGTAFKTMFARIEGLKLGETLEDGVTLNQYSTVLKKIGVNILDANGQLKEMDTILDSIGERWQTLSQATKVATAQQVAGLRQYQQFIALMDNYDKVLQNQDIAENATGTLQSQFKTYQNSIEALKTELEKAKEDVYSKLFSADNVKQFLEAFKFIFGYVEKIVTSMGGLKGIILMVGGMLISNYMPRIQEGILRIKQNFEDTWGITLRRQKESLSLMQQFTQASSDTKSIQAGIQGQKGGASLEEQSAVYTARILELSQEKLKINSALTDKQREHVQLQLEEISNLAQIALHQREILENSKEELSKEENKLKLQLKRAERNNNRRYEAEKAEADKKYEADKAEAERKYQAETEAANQKYQAAQEKAGAVARTQAERENQQITRFNDQQTAARAPIEHAMDVRSTGIEKLGVNKDGELLSGKEVAPADINTGYQTAQSELNKEIAETSAKIEENKTKIQELKDASSELAGIEKQEYSAKIKQLEQENNELKTKKTTLEETSQIVSKGESKDGSKVSSQDRRQVAVDYLTERNKEDSAKLNAMPAMKPLVDVEARVKEAQENVPKPVVERQEVERQEVEKHTLGRENTSEALKDLQTNAADEKSEFVPALQTKVAQILRSVTEATKEAIESTPAEEVATEGQGAAEGQPSIDTLQQAKDTIGEMSSNLEVSKDNYSALYKEAGKLTTQGKLYKNVSDSINGSTQKLISMKETEFKNDKQRESVEKSIKKEIAATSQYVNNQVKNNKDVVKSLVNVEGKYDNIKDAVIKAVDKGEELDLSKMNTKQLKEVGQLFDDMSTNATQSGDAVRGVADAMGQDLQESSTNGEVTAETLERVATSAEHVGESEVLAEEGAERFAAKAQQISIVGDTFGRIAQMSGQVVGALSSGAMGLSMMTSSFDQLTTSIAEGGNAMQILVSASMMLRGATMALNAINSASTIIQGIKIGLQYKEAGALDKQTKKTLPNTVATVANSAAKIFNALANKGVAGVIIAVALVAVMGLTIAYIANTIQTKLNTKAKQEEAEATANAAESSKNHADKVKKEYDELVKLNNEYERAYNVWKESKDNKLELNEAIRNVTTKLQLENVELDIQTGHYEALNQKIRENLQLKGEEATRAAQGSVDAAVATATSKIDVAEHKEKGVQYDDTDEGTRFSIRVANNQNDKDAFSAFWALNYKKYSDAWEYPEGSDTLHFYSTRDASGASELDQISSDYSNFLRENENWDLSPETNPFSKAISDSRENGTYDVFTAIGEAGQTYKETKTSSELTKRGLLFASSSQDYYKARKELEEDNTLTSKEKQDAIDILTNDENTKEWESNYLALKNLNDRYGASLDIDMFSLTEDQQKAAIELGFLPPDHEEALKAINDEVKLLEKEDLSISIDLIPEAKKDLKSNMTSKEMEEYQEKYSDIFDKLAEKGMTAQEFWQQSTKRQKELIDEIGDTDTQIAIAEQEIENYQTELDTYDRDRQFQIEKDARYRQKGYASEQDFNNKFNAFEQTRPEDLTDDIKNPVLESWTNQLTIDGHFISAEAEKGLAKVFGSLDNVKEEWFNALVSGNDEEFAKKWHEAIPAADAAGVQAGLNDWRETFADAISQYKEKLQPITEFKTEEERLKAIQKEVEREAGKTADDNLGKIQTNLEIAEERREKLIDQQIGEKIAKLDIDYEEFDAYVEYLQSINTELAKNPRLAKQVAIAAKSLEKGFADAADHIDDFDTYIIKGNKQLPQYQTQVKQLQKDLSLMLNQKVSDDMVQAIAADTVAMNLFKKAVNGSDTAWQQFLSRTALQQTIGIDYDKDGVDATEQDIITAFDELQNNLDLEVGVSLNEAKLTETFQTLLDTGKITKDQLEDVFATFGWTPEITYEPVELTGENKAKIATNGGYYLPNENGEQEWHPIQGEVELDNLGVETVYLPVINGNKTIKSTPPKAATTLNATKDNSSSKSFSKADTKNPRDETERYHVINKQTDQLANAYDRLSTAKDRAFGANRLKLMDKEIDNLKKQIALNQEYINQAKAYAQEDLNNLINGKAQGFALNGEWYQSEGLKDLGVNIQLDENGVIENYDEIMAAATARYNERIAAYNATGDSGSNLKDIADKEYEALIDALKQFEESNELVQEKLDENQKLINQLQDANLNKFQYKIELKLKITDTDRKTLEHEINALGDDAFKSAEVLSKIFSTEGNSKWSTTVQDLKTYMDSYNELNKLYEEGQISEEGYFDGLETTKDGILAQLDAIIDIKGTMEDYYSNTLSKLKEKYDELRSSMAQCTEVLEHFKTILELSGRSTDYASIDAILQGEAQAAEDSLAVSAANYKKDQELYEARKKEYEKALASGGEESIKIAKNQMDAAEAAMNESYNEWLTDTENYMNAIKAIITNSIEATSSEVENLFTDGMGWDYLQQKMDFAEATQDRYYTKTNQLYETEKMRRKLQQDIDKTTNSAAKQRLAQFEQEIDAMQTKNELSKTELSLAQAQYELLLAQIALEEAQNAKTTVRLQRDAEGNYGYVYTADQNKVADAEQRVADAENNLYNTAREAENETLKQSFEINQEYQAKLKELWEDETLTYEEKEKRQEELEQMYTDRLEKLQNEHAIAENVLVTTSSTHANDTWTKTYEELGTKQTAFQDQSKKLWKELKEILTGEDGKSGLYGKLKDAGEQVLGPSLDSIKDKVGNITAKSKELKEELVGTDGKGGLVQNIKDEASAVAELTAKYGEQYDAMVDVLAKAKEINDEIDELIEKAAEDIVIKTTYEDTHNIQYNVHTDYTQTGTPPVISTTTTDDPNNKGLGGLDDIEVEVEDDDDDDNKEEEDLTKSGTMIRADGNFETNSIQISNSNSKIFDGEVYVKVKTKPARWVKLNDLANASLEQIQNTSGTRFRNMTHSINWYEWTNGTNGKGMGSSGGSGARVYGPAVMLKMDTGGYTGDWFSSSQNPDENGKLALLHQKELVLNQEDTKNMLTAVNIVRSLQEALDLRTAAYNFDSQLASGVLTGANGELEQNITINADFPNVQDHNEIKEALENLALRAAQYAARNK